MKKSQQHISIIACLLPALLVLSQVVSAEDSSARYIKQGNVVNSEPVFWSIPPINKRWSSPPRRDAWTIPPISRQWGNPMPALHWTIPRTASDLLTTDE